MCPTLPKLHGMNFGRKSMKFTDVLRFFDEKQVKKECESCGRESWIVNISDEDEGKLHGLSVVDYVDGQTFFKNMYSAGMATVSVECSHCGYVRLFNAAKIAEWAMANKEPSAAAASEQTINSASKGDHP